MDRTFRKKFFNFFNFPSIDLTIGGDGSYGMGRVGGGVESVSAFTRLDSLNLISTFPATFFL